MKKNQKAFNAEDVAKRMMGQSLRMEYKIALRSMSVVGVIVCWELFRAFLFPIISNNYLYNAAAERKEMMGYMTAIQAEFDRRSETQKDAVVKVLEACGAVDRTSSQANQRRGS